jgi:hypothetical protein
MTADHDEGTVQRHNDDKDSSLMFRSLSSQRLAAFRSRPGRHSKLFASATGRYFSGNAPAYHTVDYDFTSLVEMQIKSCEIHQKDNFIGTLVDGKFEYITFGEFGAEVDKFRGVLAVHQVGVNDKVATVRCLRHLSAFQ